MLKRLLDLFAALAGLVAFTPLLVAVATWIKLDSPGPVFYRGRRAGRNGRPFGIFKFRSMVVNADRVGGPSTSDDDCRVTRSGRFIRKFKLDELSQLINVLLGDMSLVGPRPEIVDKVEKYSEAERAVLSLRPGITDWASIWNSDEGGLLDGTPDPDAAYEAIIRPIKLELQRSYCESRSLVGDVKIVLCTIRKIIDNNFTPNELAGYPSFHEMRNRILDWVKTQSGDFRSAAA